jgi:hypothetical protein
MSSAKTKSTPGTRLRAARIAAGLSCETAGRRCSPPISGQSWGDAERGRTRSLDWWHSAALALGIDPHSLDERLASKA